MVPEPGAVIVTGDLIRGVPIGHPKWQETMREQYAVAQAFLDTLTARFLNGDRSRLVLIPGNHDVCWNTAFSAMERVPDADCPRDIRKALLAADSPYRWSWKDRALYKIGDQTLYVSPKSRFGLSDALPLRHSAPQIFRTPSRSDFALGSSTTNRSQKKSPGSFEYKSTAVTDTAPAAYRRRTNSSALRSVLKPLTAVDALLACPMPATPALQPGSVFAKET